MTGAELIAAERQRQVEVECFDAAHDATHIDCELVRAARAYTWAAICLVEYGGEARDMDIIPNDFPWSREWWKPATDAVRNLVKAGALIAAEIDRLQRMR